MHRDVELRESCSEGLLSVAWRLGLLREDCSEGLLAIAWRDDDKPKKRRNMCAYTPAVNPVTSKVQFTELSEKLGRIFKFALTNSVSRKEY